MKKTYEHEYKYEFMDINQYYYIKFNHQFPLIYKISNKDIYKYDKFFYNLTFNNVKNIYHISGYFIKNNIKINKIPYYPLTYDIVKSKILKKYPLLSIDDIEVLNEPYCFLIPFIKRKIITYPSYDFKVAKEIKFQTTNYVLFEKYLSYPK